MVGLTKHRVLTGAVLAAVAALAACAPKAPPPPPPPPPAPQPFITIPARPVPPLGVSSTMLVPPRGPDGVRQTVNAHISRAQTTWNFRSAYNVAALNCRKAEHVAILAGYRAFLTKHKRALTDANRAVDNEFRQRYGARFIAPRESYMTQVYNYFANPVTLDAFCDATLAVNAEAQTVSSKDLDLFTANSLPRIEAVFEDLFRSYENYQLAAADWDMKYGALRPAVAEQPAGIGMGASTGAGGGQVRTQR